MKLTGVERKGLEDRGNIKGNTLYYDASNGTIVPITAKGVALLKSLNAPVNLKTVALSSFHAETLRLL
jgi:hypothetical protein